MQDNKKFIIRCRAIIFYEGKLLVVRHAPTAKFLALPGGHLEYGENVKECMEREVVEELGVKPEIGRLLYVHTFIEVDVPQAVEFFFEIKNGKDYVNCENNNRSHAGEISEMQWVGPDNEVTILPKRIADDLRAGSLLSDEVRYI